MPDLPFELQEEILKRLPVKSLLQFRCVSKRWKSLIDSPNFITRYRGRLQHLLVTYASGSDEKSEVKFVLVADDHTFPQQKLSLTPPPLLDGATVIELIGCSHGLLCFSARFTGNKSLTDVLWNVSIQKAVFIDVPKVGYGLFRPVIGFGVCKGTGDPKIVKINQIQESSDGEQIEVFTLSRRAWRKPYCSNLPRKSIGYFSFQVFVDGILYWLARDSVTDDDFYNLIISFDVTSEEFGEIMLPDNLASQFDYYYTLSMTKLKESLVVLEPNEDDDNPVFFLWIMENGVQKSFTKLFAINDSIPEFVTGFRKSGEIIVEIMEGGRASHQLFVYDPHSKHMDNLGIQGIAFTGLVHPYMETLLLLDQPDLTI